MGYTTVFTGEFGVTPTLKPEHKAYLDAFAATRRMGRRAADLRGALDPVREAAGLNTAGPQGGFYVGGDERMGTINCNTPPRGQPGLWCQWVPNADGTEIVWDEGEKFYYYVEWIEYLVAMFLAPWGYTLNGCVNWQGEESDDRGVIYIKDNAVEAVDDTITNSGPSWGRKPVKK